MLSEKIINLRKSRGWSQEELAEKLEAAAQNAGEFCFIIGSSHGLDERVKRACDVLCERAVICKFAYGDRVRARARVKHVLRLFYVAGLNSRAVRYNKYVFSVKGCVSYAGTAYLHTHSFVRGLHLRIEGRESESVVVRVFVFVNHRDIVARAAGVCKNCNASVRFGP